MDRQRPRPTRPTGPQNRPAATPPPPAPAPPTKPQPKTPRAPNDFRHAERPAWNVWPPTLDGLLGSLDVEDAPFADQYRAVRDYVRLPAARGMPGAIRSDLRRRNLLPRRGNGRAMVCGSLADVRANIDRVDEEIVELLAERAAYVRQAAQFKTDAAAVADPLRAERVVAQARGFALDRDLDPDLIEGIYRELIAGFIRLEQNVERPA